MAPPTNIRVLLIGNGGREHALAWKLSQSPLVSHIYCCPGNGGTASVSNATNVAHLSPADFPALADFALSHAVDLLVPGPEAPLVSGIVDTFRTRAPSVLCFGPDAAAARMEGSKAFAKAFMARHAIPTAAHASFSDYDTARGFLDAAAHPVVIKASGLAAGKGVVLPTDKEEAHATLREMMLERSFGAAGDEVVLEERLEGEELSILTFCDGTTFASLPPAQDHKRALDGDHGPNTGGMGTYAPAACAPAAVLRKIDETILRPTIAGMAREGFPFVGVLFTGLMLTAAGPRVLEYNVRFGDPETQSLLALMEGDLAGAMLACARGQLVDSAAAEIRAAEGRNAVTVVVAAGGYPGSYQKGVQMQISGSLAKGVVLFHAGTEIGEDGVLRTAGGRVIASTAVAGSLREAADRAYEGVAAIQFDGMQYRKDIAHQAL